MTGRQVLLRALAIGSAAAGLAWILGAWSGTTRLVLMAATAVAFVALVLPRLGVRWLEEAVHAARSLLWRNEQGRHHAFGGVPLHIHDDGRHVWIAASDLQRALGTEDPEDVLAARHSGRWRRDARNTLWLRVDGVVDRLSHGPTRLDPRTARLRSYFDRDVLFPAAQRRRQR